MSRIFNKCDRCGANLDPCEKCDCENKQINSNKNNQSMKEKANEKNTKK